MSDDRTTEPAAGHDPDHGDTNRGHTNDGYANDIDVLREWVGRSRSSTDTITPAWCQRLAATLPAAQPGHDPTAPAPTAPAPTAAGDPLPPLWHFATHVPTTPTERLDRDGHPTRGDFLPPVALPRRMWAGGRLTFTGRLRVGDEVTKTSTIASVDTKSGRSGQLCFVTVHHELAVDGATRIIEEQDLVYREDPAPGTAPPPPRPAPTDAQFRRTITPTPVLLFRYSAITFNSHRIHYDRDYARDIEGYGGLVVHGPLTATLLASLALPSPDATLAEFTFRGVSAILDTAPFTIAGNRHGDDVELWAAGPDGALTMTATAVLA